MQCVRAVDLCAGEIGITTNCREDTLSHKHAFKQNLFLSLLNICVLRHKDPIKSNLSAASAVPLIGSIQFNFQAVIVPDS